MVGLVGLFLSVFLCMIPNIAGQCLTPDAVPPNCKSWIDPVDQIPIFFQHQFNCSRFWVCEPDLSDCLHECAPKPGGGALYFDFNIDHEHGGPVCNWPEVVDCTNKPEVCGECQPWEECVKCIDCTDCPGCENAGDDDWTCICKEGGTCQGNNAIACGTCSNHVCEEPECCTNEDCQGAICDNGVCKGCASDNDCTNTACSTCMNHACHDPECCVDEDCNGNEYCDTDNGVCVEGCRDNSDCTAMVCSTCENHQCVDPECCIDADCLNTQFCEDNKCKDGCNEDSDCSMNGECATCNIASHQCTEPQCCNDSNCTPEFLECSVCQADQTCTNPECCEDSDCPNEKPICDTDGHVCIAGCKKHSDCAGFNEICNGDYTADGASCFYCNNDNNANVVGECVPGCLDDNNCKSDEPICNGQHRCTEKGGANILSEIKFTTESCSGCSNNKIEGGPKLTLIGQQSTSGPTGCSTNGLDHPNDIDFTAGNKVSFRGEKDKDLLDGCYLSNLQGQVNGGTIMWTGEGSLSLRNGQVDIAMADATSCLSSCCVSGALVTGQQNNMNCFRNCGGNSCDQLMNL
eukprot:TRINITY_DN1872_c0_g1_i3.p1 TRINITY_DN1872_c0_g1~~TRINITY_DN1872_c0_g1_i3.p1  ORF type:complete len:575 (+),score=73.51 TRINITY_DN1872_c0_g1_i3:154-1878(+)